MPSALRRRRVEMQLAEEPAERLLLVGREVLVAEEDDAVSISAAWTSLKVRSSRGRERSTPWTSAPAWGVSFSTWIDA